MHDEDLVRLTYASTSSTRESGGGTAIDPEISRILRACKVNNPRLRVGGVLHYGHGFFLQVLEGPRAGVEALFRRIARDPRHRDVQTLECRSVDARRFPDWSMKYVPLESDVGRVLRRNRLPAFDPYSFDAATIEDLIGVLVGSNAPNQDPDQDYARRPSFLGRLLGRV